jgi:hypothetical protein
MSSRQLSGGLSGFLYEHVTSYEHLEALLLLHARTADTWSAAAVAQATHLTDAAAEQCLEDLCSSGICGARDVDGERVYRFAPSSPAIAAFVAELAAAYDADPLGVVHSMNSNALHRVRNRAARAFADAFVLGKKKDK